MGSKKELILFTCFSTVLASFTANDGLFYNVGVLKYGFDLFLKEDFSLRRFVRVPQSIATPLGNW